MAESEKSKTTVLVVDDDASVLRVAGKVLRRAGYDVVEASGGPEALDLLKGRPDPVALLVTDVLMPGMGGREVADAARALVPGLRVLFMSAYTEDQVVLRGVRVAQVSFLQKPFSVVDLQNKVREVLSAPPDEAAPS